MLHAIILAIVQGLTEFIPVSSSAHLVIIPWLFQWKADVTTSLSFDVSLHIGTLLAVVVFFWKDWVRIIGAWFASIRDRKIGEDPDRRLSWFLLAACVPGGIAGVLFEGKINNLFHGDQVSRNAMYVMACGIALLAILLLLADRLGSKRKSIGEMSWKDALLIGVAQAFAIFPGISRSGSTITAGRALGYQREDAARFSFLLGTPIILGAGLKSAYEVVKGFAGGSIPSSEMAIFPVGLLVSAVVGFFCIKYLLAFLKNHSMKVFVYYRLILAIVILGTLLFRA